MRLLLDTHVAVWLVTNDPKLSARARSLIVDEATAVNVSLVTLWEVAIKRSLPASRFGELAVSAAVLMQDFQAANIELLGVSPEHACAIELLPWHHRDPFDRMLVAQAMHEPLRLVTSDKVLARYSDTVILV